jgi:hypothetical protein
VIEFNRPRSTVTIAGTLTVPAVALVCPPAGDLDEPASERTIGHAWRKFNRKPPVPVELGAGDPGYQECLAFVPLENGVLYSINGYTVGESAAGQFLYDVSLYFHVCELVTIGEDPCWLPIGGTLHDRRITAYCWPGTTGHHFWPHAEEGWVAEHLARMATTPTAPPPDGPRVRPLRLAEIDRAMGWPAMAGV